MMSEHLDWTQKLGDAVLGQQTDVLDAIQRLRARAQTNGKLESTKEQTVTVKTENQKQYVAIEPTPPTEIYVPYYEPSVVYGDWPYPDYAPYYFPSPSGYFTGGVLATGIAFAAGIAVRHAFWGNCDWGRGNINVVTNRTANVNNVNRGKWEHNPDHRRGVRYNNADVRQKFSGRELPSGKAPQGPRAGDRDRPAGADRAGPAAGNRERSSAATRERASAGDRNRPQPQGIGARPESGNAKAAKAAQRPNQQSGPQGRTQANRSGPSAGASGGTPRAANRGGGAHRPAAHAGGGGHRVAGHGGGGHRAAARSSGGRAGGGRGGRRSDVALKHDIIFLGRLDNGLGFYRFSYNGSDQPYVGVIAQEVQSIMPDAVVRGPDGYLRVYYNKLGLKFQKYDQWIASGARIPRILSKRY